LSKSKRNKKAQAHQATKGAYSPVQDSSPSTAPTTTARGSAFDTFENQLARLGSASENIISD
jgi:hypothetical protein